MNSRRVAANMAAGGRAVLLAKRGKIDRTAKDEHMIQGNL